MKKLRPYKPHFKFKESVESDETMVTNELRSWFERNRNANKVFKTFKGFRDWVMDDWYGDSTSGKPSVDWESYKLNLDEYVQLVTPDIAKMYDEEYLGIREANLSHQSWKIFGGVRLDSSTFVSEGSSEKDKQGGIEAMKRDLVDEYFMDPQDIRQLKFKWDGAEQYGDEITHSIFMTGPDDILTKLQGKIEDIH